MLFERKEAGRVDYISAGEKVSDSTFRSLIGAEKSCSQFWL